MAGGDQAGWLQALAKVDAKIESLAADAGAPAASSARYTSWARTSLLARRRRG